MSSSSLLAAFGVPFVRRLAAGADLTGLLARSLSCEDEAMLGELPATEDGVFKVVEAGEVLVVEASFVAERGRGAGPGLGLPKKPMSVDCFSLMRQPCSA